MDRSTANIKKFFSVVLLDVVDAEYKFLYCDKSSSGASLFASIFNDTKLKASLENDELRLPDQEPLPGDDILMPYFLAWVTTHLV